MYLKKKNCLYVRTFLNRQAKKQHTFYSSVNYLYFVYMYVFFFLLCVIRYRSRSFATMYYLFCSFSSERSADLTVGALICCKFQENQEASAWAVCIWLICWVCSAVVIIAHAVNLLLLILVQFNHSNTQKNAKFYIRFV